MYDDLAFREYRIPFKHIAIYGAVCAAGYGVIAAFGLPAVCAIAGLTVGYVVAQVKK